MLCNQCGQPIPRKKCIPPLFNKRGFVSHNHPLRGEVCSLSSGPVYYPTLGDFSRKLGEVLAKYDLSTDLGSLGQTPRKDGGTYEVFPVVQNDGTVTGNNQQDIVITTYKMESGRWEVITHLT